MPFDHRFPYPLYLVLSENDCRAPWLWVAEQAILGGVDIIQLREKSLSRVDLVARAEALKRLTDRYDIPLVINDYADVAAEVGAWGVHVGRHDVCPLAIRELYGDKLRIGWSVEALEQLHSNQLEAVDYLGISPVFSTPTKTDTVTEWGLAGIRRIREETDLPLVAIGNMNETTAPSAYLAGANSIAVVSAICRQDNPQQASQTLKKLLLHERETR